MNQLVKKIETLFDKKILGWFLVALFFVSGVALTFIASGTCDEGDSVMHYQFAKWAPLHHELFFNHWAKPLYVLLASVPAQFGIHGIKLFNITISAIALLFTLLVASRLSIPRVSLAVLFMMMSPGLIVYSLSGLTEPLFALVLIVSIWLYLNNKIFWSIILVSFLPFVRSEGLMMCGVFAALLILEKRWKMLPLLMFGHFAYGIAGYSTHHNFLWTFTEIPYVGKGNNYGQGQWNHFFVNILYIIGVPLYILLGFGLIVGVRKLFGKELFFEHKRELFLIYGCFCAYFFGHVIFWRFGIFHSFGMLRVLVAVLPLMAIIELRGVNLGVDWIGSRVVRSVVLLSIIAYVTIFPFARNLYAWNYKRDFCATTGQEVINDLGIYINSNYSHHKECNYYFDANYTSIVIGFDFFDKKVSRSTWEIWDSPPHHSFLIWDDWFSVVEAGTKLENLMNDNRFEFVKEFSREVPGDNTRRVVLFKSKDF